MTTSRTAPMLYEIEHKLPIPLEKRAYFHARVLNSFYQYIFEKFLEEEQAGRLTRAELARRIERKPEVITRLFGAPGNWTLETMTDLLLGICGEELQPSSAPLLGRSKRNFLSADWLKEPKPAVQLQKESETSTTPPIKSEVTLHAPV